MWQFSCYLNPLNRVWLGVQELTVLWVVWFLTSGNAHSAYHCCLALVLFAFSATPSPPTSWMWFFSSCLCSHFWNGAKIKFPDASNSVHFNGLSSLKCFHCSSAVRNSLNLFSWNSQVFWRVLMGKKKKTFQDLRDSVSGLQCSVPGPHTLRRAPVWVSCVQKSFALTDDSQVVMSRLE